MSVQRTYYCEAPDCEAHASTATPPPYLPVGFLGVRESEPGAMQEERHFCGWECVMRYAATLPPPESIEFGDEGDAA